MNGVNECAGAAPKAQRFRGQIGGSVGLRVSDCYLDIQEAELLTVMCP